MHAGFAALRAQWPMNARATGRRTPMTAELRADIERIDALWGDCRARFGVHGPWLFGDYSLADAMHAPVVLRFRSYGAALQQWIAAAVLEPWSIDYSEVGLPSN